jgi:hypothetical protein
MPGSGRGACRAGLAVVAAPPAAWSGSVAAGQIAAERAAQVERGGAGWRSGQPWQAVPKVTALPAVICRVIPAGQVTVPAALSTEPPGLRDLRVCRAWVPTVEIPWSSTAASL